MPLWFSATPFVPGLWLALLLDALIGDPAWLVHPVVLIGRATGKTACFFRAMLPDRPMLAGLLTVLLTLALTLSACVLFFLVLGAVSVPALTGGAIVLLWTTLALRGLSLHGLAVYRALTGPETDRLEAGRAAVAMIVGRDTSRLDEQGVVRACVESVAENMSDGVVAPMFYGLAGNLAAVLAGLEQYGLAAAATAAMLYKAVNTMDSMFGYTNEEFLFFGRPAALLDDALNILPARISGLALVTCYCLVRPVAAARFTGSGSCGYAWRILWRDHAAHASPNAGWPEAAMAGLLGIRLGGAGVYFGQRVVKPCLGDNLTSPEPRHICAAVLWMVLASLCCASVFTFLAFICVI